MFPSKNYSPQQIAFFAAIPIGLITGIAAVATGLNWKIGAAVFIILCCMSYLLLVFLLPRFIYWKIKLIYKLISQTKPTPEAKPEPKPAAEPASKPDAEAKAKPEKEAGQKPETTTQHKPEAKSKPKGAPKPATKTTPNDQPPPPPKNVTPAKAPGGPRALDAPAHVRHLECDVDDAVTMASVVVKEHTPGAHPALDDEAA